MESPLVTILIITWNRKKQCSGVCANNLGKARGISGHAILLDLKDDQELPKYSEEKVRTIWRF
jgi:hypothetical protein